MAAFKQNLKNLASIANACRKNKHIKFAKVIKTNKFSSSSYGSNVYTISKIFQK